MAAPSSRQLTDWDEFAFCCHITASQEEELKQLPDWNVGVDEAEEDGGSPSVDWRGNEQVETEPTEGTTSTDSPDRLYEHASVAPTTCSVASQLPLRRDSGCNVEPPTPHLSRGIFQPAAVIPSSQGQACETKGPNDVSKKPKPPDQSAAASRPVVACSSHSRPGQVEHHPENSKKMVDSIAVNPGKTWMTPLGPLIDKLWGWSSGNHKHGSSVHLAPALQGDQASHDAMPASHQRQDTNPPNRQEHEQDLLTACSVDHASVVCPSGSPALAEGSAGGEHGLPAAEAHNGGSDIQPEKSLREVTTMSDSAALHTAMQAVGATASLPPRKRYRRTGLEIVCQYFKLSDADLDI